MTIFCWSCESPVYSGDYCIKCSFGAYPTPVRFSRYVVKRHLGGGAFGDVFECFDPVVDRRVAVKKLSKLVSSSLLSEVRAIGRLNHPNVVHLYDADEQLGILVMELIEGGNLADEMKLRPESVRKNFSRLFIGICEGIRAAHLERVMHRDLKPENILLTKDGEPKVADFGLAKAMAEGDTIFSLAGSPAYMAPEVIWNEDYNESVDLHSLGCVMYEAWTGRLPFDQPGGRNALATQKQRPPVDAPRDVDPTSDDVLNELILGLLAAPGERIQSVETVIEQLRQREPERLDHLTSSLDELQFFVGGIYGIRNRQRSPLLLLAHFGAAISGVIGGMTHPDVEYGTRRTEAYFPRAFCWLCALASSLNLRLSQLVWLKYDNHCPYCKADVCNCSAGDRLPDPERNRILLEELTGRKISEAPPSKTFGQYQAMFKRLYGNRNDSDGVPAVGLHAFFEINEAFDALLRIESLDSLRQPGALRLELSDLVAWFFALLNMYRPGYSLVGSFEELLGHGCYVCLKPSCECPSIDTELKMASWREL